MAFTFSTNSGCNADVNHSTYNPTRIDTTSASRSAHINEMRKALEQFYVQHNGKHAIAAIDWAVSVTPAEGPLRMANINELRHAINKMRVLMRRCHCAYDGCCHCHNAGGCWMGSVCHVNTYYKYSTTMTAYSFSNNTGDTSVNGAYSRKEVGSRISDTDVKQLQYWVNFYNTTNYNWQDGNWNLEF